jgi:hypothetical protein
MSEMYKPLPQFHGEIFNDGSVRGYLKPDHEKIEGAIMVGDYMIWESIHEPAEIGIAYMPTGEMGTFKTAEFETYIKAFFGLNF